MDDLEQWSRGVDDSLDPLASHKKAIANIESGGKYELLGPVTKKGDRAYGKYQVMGANIPEWTRAALGQALTPAQFLSSPEAQEKVFEHRFGGYLQKYGPEGAASAWFTGRPEASNVKDVLGTSRNQYVKQYLNSLGRTPEVSGKVETLDDLNSDFRNAVEQHEAQLVAPQISVPESVLPGSAQEAVRWNAPREIASGAFLNKGPQISAAVAAGKEAVGDVFRGTNPAEAWNLAKNIYYPQALSQYQEAQKGYEMAQPGQAAVANLAGQAIPIIGGIGATNALLRAGARVVPAFAPAAETLMGTGGQGFFGQRLSDVASGALQGAVADTVTGHDPLTGAGFGAVAGAVGNPLLRGLTAPLRAKAMPEVAQAAQEYIGMGGELPGGAIVQGPAKGAVTALAGKGETEAVEKLSEMLANRIDAPDLSPQGIALGKESIERSYGLWDSVHSLPVDQHLMDRLWAIRKLAEQKVNDSAIKPEVGQAIKGAIDQIEDVATGNISGGNFVIPGAAFRAMVKSEGVIDDLFKDSKAATPFAQLLKKTLFSSLERMNPKGAKELGQINQKWKDLTRISKIAPTNASGLVDPNKLRRFGKDRDEFGKIAKMAEYLPKVDASGTVKGHSQGPVASWLAHKLPHGAAGMALGGGLGAVLGEHGLHWIPQVISHPTEAIFGSLGALGALGASKSFGRYLASPEYTQKVIQNTLAPRPAALLNPLAITVPTLSTRPQ